MTTEDLITYYQSLLIVQYQNKDNALDTVSAFVGEAIANQIVLDVRDAFDLDTAIGVQLDVLGTYRGLNRFIYGLSVTKTFFSMPASADADIGTVPGFANANDTDNDITWFWLRSQDLQAVSYRMTDQEYRTVIQFRAKVHSSNFGLGELDDILFSFFGTFVTIIDNLNMTVTYNDDPADPSNIFNLVHQSNSAPKPAGCALVFTNS